MAEEEAKKALAKSATTTTSTAAPPPPDIYQKGQAVGTYYTDGTSVEVAVSDIFLYNISMRKGLVSGYGLEEGTGMTTITGCYDSEGHVSFQMEFERTYNIPTRYFKGSCERKGGNGFYISGFHSLEEGKFDNERLIFSLQSPDDDGV